MGAVVVDGTTCVGISVIAAVSVGAIVGEASPGSTLEIVVGVKDASSEGIIVIAEYVGSVLPSPWEGVNVSSAACVGTVVSTT